MTRKISTFVALLVAATLVGGAPTVAPALTLDTVSVLWDNPLGPGFPLPPGNVITRTGVGAGLPADPAPRDTTEIRWGTPFPASALDTDKSGLGFDQFFPPSTVVPTDNTPFQLGTLFHFNNPIVLGTQLTSVDLTLGLTFAAAVPATSTFKFRMLINETPNNGSPCAEGGAQPCRDAIRFVSLDTSPEEFMIPGDPDPFTLFMVGFGPGGSQTAFFSPEGTTNNTPLFVRITRPTPNPSALLLIGLGLVGLAGISRIRSRQN